MTDFPAEAGSHALRQATSFGSVARQVAATNRTKRRSARMPITPTSIIATPMDSTSAGAIPDVSLEERHWRPDTSLQGGLVTRSAGHTYRIFAQWYDGRATLGQFSRYSEASFSIGLKMDI
jgi:hypothetical protein